MVNTISCLRWPRRDEKITCFIRCTICTGTWSTRPDVLLLSISSLICLDHDRVTHVKNNALHATVAAVGGNPPRRCATIPTADHRYLFVARYAPPLQRGGGGRGGKGGRINKLQGRQKGAEPSAPCPPLPASPRLRPLSEGDSGPLFSVRVILPHRVGEKYVG